MAEGSSSSSAHSADELKRGIGFILRYVGCMKIQTSMKALDFDLRTALAKEAIFCVCEAANFIPGRKNRRVDKRAKLLLGNGAVDLSRAGEDVELVVSSGSLSIHRLATQEIISSHSMPNISFASGGEEETVEFVCYVGKDEKTARQCYVFECGSSLAQEVLSAIGQAFALRFHEFQNRSKALSGNQTPESPNLINLESPPPHQKDFPQSTELSSELWFHGPISRQEAEARLKEEGDFLVRESSQGMALTGLQRGAPKHLLLIDAEGKVRTKDREFHSVSHLIEYHRQNNLPITSAESALLLKRPVIRQ